MSGLTEIESTLSPLVVLVIHVNIQIVGLILLSSILQKSLTVAWHEHEDVDLSVWNDAYGITRTHTTVAGARGCEKSRISNQHEDRLPRFRLRGCVKP